MSAEIIAVGRYSSDIANLMDYPADYYASTEEGAIVTRRLFGISEGSTLSREFAAFLGISDAWDFNQHKLDNSKIDINGLRQWAAVYSDYLDDVEVLDGLRRARFELYFRPEG